MKTGGSSSPKSKRQPSKVKSITEPLSQPKTGGSSSPTGGLTSHFGQITEEQRQAGIEKARQSRDRQKSWLKSCTKTYTILESRYPSHANKIKQLESGSLKAAIKLKCIDCTLGSMDDIKNCSVVSCPLWPVRHWKAVEGATDDQP